MRVLTDDTVVVISDPGSWLQERLRQDCGELLGALPGDKGVPAWAADLHRRFAAFETAEAYRPALLEALVRADHLAFTTCDGPPVPPATQSVWPSATREMRVPDQGPERDRTLTDTADIAYFSYAKLPFRLHPGQLLEVQDRWGARASVRFDPERTISWALKVDQVGFQPDAFKFAYLGGWLGPAGPLDLARYDGATFEVVEEESGKVALRGKVTPRGADPPGREPITGEQVHEIDLTAVRSPGVYHIRVASLGRSPSFVVGQAALGEAFYTHARGLFHARCAPLPAERTPWARGDAHQRTLRAAFPPDVDDYRDHAAQGWGIRDQAGRHVAYDPFRVVALTATAEEAPGVRGGWHDAADYDRRGLHLDAVDDLAHAFVLSPGTFTDSQLNLPESGNEVPDLLDEAAFGIDVFRRGQGPDGRVSTWVETTSHPRVADPGRDQQPYYLSLATRNGSLRYAASAALLARAFSTAGLGERAATYLESARRAYAFGTDPSVRVSTSFEDRGARRTFTEPPSPDVSRRLQALVQLALATGDRAYRDDLADPSIEKAFHKALEDAHWRGSPFYLADVALSSGALPASWSEKARARLLALADERLAWQRRDLYRKAWYPPEHPYFKLMGWGASGFAPLRLFVAAWRATGEERFRMAALLGVNWLHGGNPQGRVNTTGLGARPAVSVLHLPSTVDDLGEPVPGITLFGYTGQTAFADSARVHGLFADPRADLGFAGTHLALLPPPWADRTLSRARVAELLGAVVPLWRRETLLENENPPAAEFSVHETIAPAAAVTGLLLGPGWAPSAALRARKPRSEAELAEARVVLP